MRALPMVLAMFTACNGDKDGTGNPTDTGLPPGPVSFDLRTSTSATSFEAGVVEAALRAHQTSSMFLAAAALVVADEKVQDRLNTDGGGSYLRGAPLQCWERPAYPMFSFVLNYSTAPCESFGISGGVFVSDHPSGPLLLEFNNLAIQDGANPREIGGVLALDTRGAYPEQLYWQTYDTDATNPGVDNSVPIGVEVDRALHGLNYTGGASIDFQGTWSMWGVATITVDDQELTVVHGARTPEEVAPDEPTGVDVLKSPLNWLECRCPTSGVEALDMPLQFSSVTIDIDDLEVEPDDVDDPEVTVPVDHQLFGQAVLEHTGCGSYDVDYQTEAVEIPVPTQQLVGAISFLCATAAIADEQRCAALVAAAANLDEDLRIQITQEQATSVALQAVESDFDTTWCQVY